MTHREYLVGFDAILQEMRELTASKNADYAELENAFANFNLVEEMGVVSTEEGIVVRMCDKFKRMINLLKRKEKVDGETIEDTLKDLSIYSVILLLYLRSKGVDNSPLPF